MRTPKSLSKLQSVFVPLGTVEVLTFRMHGQIQTGFAIVDQDKNGDKWLVVNRCTSTRTYEKTLRGLVANIAPMHTGYKFGVPDLTRKAYISETNDKI